MDEVHHFSGRGGPGPPTFNRFYTFFGDSEKANARKGINIFSVPTDVENLGMSCLFWSRWGWNQQYSDNFLQSECLPTVDDVSHSFSQSALTDYTQLHTNLCISYYYILVWSCMILYDLIRSCMILYVRIHIHIRSFLSEMIIITTPELIQVTLCRKTSCLFMMFWANFP